MIQMFNRDRIILSCLIVSGTCHVLQYWLAMRLARELENGLDNYTRLHESARYLLSVIEREGVEMNEFDAAALNIILSKE